MAKNDNERNMRDMRHDYVAPLTEVYACETEPSMATGTTYLKVGDGFDGSEEISSGSTIGFGFEGEELISGGGANNGFGFEGEDLGYNSMTQTKRRSVWDI